MDHDAVDVASLGSALLSSSTKWRKTELSVLNHCLLRSDVLPDSGGKIVNLLFRTYPFYHDRPSRRAVQECLRSLLANPAYNHASRLVFAMFKEETSKTGIAPSNALVLAEWGSILLQHCATDAGAWTTEGLALVLSHARILELCLSFSKRQSTKRSALVVTWRALRSLLHQSNDGAARLRAITSSLTQRSNSLGSRSACFLGAVAGVCARSPNLRAAFEVEKANYISFYLQEIVGSRTTVPDHLVESMKTFFSNFVTAEDVQQALAPAFEKALLRAPEVVLNDLISPMICSLPPEIDLTEPLTIRLLKPLLSCAKSTNAIIRDGAVATFIALVDHSFDPQSLENVADDVLVPLSTSKLTSADHRIAHSRMLSSLPYLPSHSTIIFKTLNVVTAKEANEAALIAEVSASTKHLLYAVQASARVDLGIVNAAKEIFSRGICDKKPQVRHVWALAAGEVLWQLKDRSPNALKDLAILIEALISKLLEVFKEMVVNIQTAGQSGLAVIGYILLACSGFFTNLVQDEDMQAKYRKASVFDQALSAPKTSFLLNYRVFTKLLGHQDLTWFIRALTACTPHLSNLDPTAKIGEAWAQAFLYVTSANDIPLILRNEAASGLTKAHSQLPETVTKTLVTALWNWKGNVVEGRQDNVAGASKTGVARLWLAVQAICPNSMSSKEGNAVMKFLPSQMISLLVLCRPEMLPNTNWIEMCLRVGQDPGDLTRDRSEDCLSEINAALSASVMQKNMEWTRVAASKAAAELAFVAPETVTPLLVHEIQTLLAPEAVKSCGPIQIAIARTPEGTAFIDVLSDKGQSNALNKNSPDYDTLRWEAEVRNQLAKKKGQEKQLTADEKKKIDAQLKKEIGIRDTVHKVEAQLIKGISLVDALATGPPTDGILWMGSCIQALLDIIDAGAGLLVADAAEKAYINCANLVSSRLGSLKHFVGIGTLRASTSSFLPSELQQEPLGELITRVSYRIRFMSEQRPFDNVSLLYMLPLIESILRRNGIDCANVEETEEQVTLAIEFLSFQMNSFSDMRLPRGRIIVLLIECMQKYTQHYKLLKDCILELCHSIAPSVTIEEKQLLLKGCIVPQTTARVSVLQAVREYIDLTDIDFSREIWLTAHDDNDDNAQLGHAIWQENAMEVEPTDAVKVLEFLGNENRQIRSAASRALAACIGKDKSVFSQILYSLQERYRDLAKQKAPERDGFGMPKKMDPTDPWEARDGIALSFKAMATNFDTSMLMPFVDFLIDSSAIGDRNAAVRSEMIDSATVIIDLHGGEKVEELTALLEKTLDEGSKNAKISDTVNEAVVILYGALARHLPDNDERVPKVVERLFVALSTPSEAVQYTVASCLPPLVRTSSAKTSDYLQKMMDQLLHSKGYAVRRGAAYGLAGIINSKGVVILRDYRILSSLKAAIENKKDQNQRQGALFAYEILSLILGRVFEPYIIQIVPQLLTGFGDASADVREACLDTAKTCFRSLSSYGVKIILPSLLEGLGESQWRSKKGACDLLGAMAYLDPQQLALSLPDIIPPLTGVLNDSHKEVRTSANRSLQRFGEVISNPEVKSLVNILLKGLSDPTKYTDDALDALIKVSFVHYLDSPSLALVVRILERGLGDRSATKRKSAQIIGSLAHLTDRKDVVPHLPVLVAGLKLAVVDPVPATRATASKALGSLVEKLGEETLPDLIPSLMSTLKSESGAGDRLGSAQALSEVLAGLGTGRLEETLPTILQNVSSSKPSVREGFMSLFIYLPACFGNSFAMYLSRTIPPILAGLADEIESIRETSLRAGRLLVKNFATKAIDLLLPELDRGLADDSHRIRLSSVQLVGDLLFNLTGISGKTEQEEEESANTAGASLLEVLGEDKRNKILSSLYICRCDTSGLVRGAAINVWKALVATPRTLKDLIPTLTQLLIRRLASSNLEQKVIAGNALGELIRKAGEGVLASLLPALEEGLQTSTDSDNKQGICIALREILSSASQDALEDYEKILIAIVRVALVDNNSDVREAAAEAFDSLQKMLGKKAVDQVLPYLLNLLRTEDEAETALAALLTLLTDNTRSNVILPNLVPTLLVAPISPFNARAIASLAQVAGATMTRRLPVILNTLIDNEIVCNDAELRMELQTAFDAILLSIDEFDGLNTLMSVMLSLVKNDDHRKRSAANLHLSNFFAKTDINYTRYHQDLIRALLLSFDDRDGEVVKAAWTALFELTRNLPKEQMEILVVSTRTVLQQVGVPGYDLPGFSLPKGIGAILPIFSHGLLNGNSDHRVQAALAISDMIDRTSADGLKTYVTQIAGPLIRAVSERSVDVKAAVLLTLNNFLEKVPSFLKPFLPQLQRTFVKSLADPSSEVLRSRAAKALGTLITLTPRIDPLIAELVTGSKTSDTGVQNAMLKALYEVVSKAGSNMNDTSRASILGLIDSDIGIADDAMTITNARLVGALVKSSAGAATTTSLIKQRVLVSHITNSSILNLNSVLLESPASITKAFANETPALICQGIGSKSTFIADNSVLAAGKFLLANYNSINIETARLIFEALASAIQPGNPVDMRRLGLVVIRTISRQHHGLISSHLPLLAPPTFAGVRDMIIPVKLAAEAAFLSLFLVEELESAEFDSYMATEGAGMNPATKRSMQDYFKRVAMRLGGQARERREAEGGQGGLGLSNDEREDEREVWSVGRVDLGEGAFGDE